MQHLKSGRMAIARSPLKRHDLASLLQRVSAGKSPPDLNKTSEPELSQIHSAARDAQETCAHSKATQADDAVRRRPRRHLPAHCGEPVATESPLNPLLPWRFAG